MDYKYPPIYKYIILLIVITTFLKYYELITKDNFLLIASIFVYISYLFDYVLIDNHPSLISLPSQNSENTKDNIEKFNDLNDKDIDDKFEIELKELDKEIMNNSNNNDTDDNLTEEIQRELDKIDI